MKSIQNFLLAICAIGILSLVSCHKENDGPSEPEFAGIFKGTFYSPTTGEPMEWVATSASAVHDTISDQIILTAKHANGEQIVILFGDSGEKLHHLYQFTTGETTYQSSNFEGIATSRSNDPTGIVGAPSSSVVEITDNGATDKRLKGIVHVLYWYIVGPDTDDDVLKGTMVEGEFEVALKKRGVSTTSSITAKIDGVSFNPIASIASGSVLTASTAEMESITITVPGISVAVGTHEINATSPYQIIYSSEGMGTGMYTYEGTITITSYKDAIPKGTFEVKATSTSNPENEVNITDGKFSF